MKKTIVLLFVSVQLFFGCAEFSSSAKNNQTEKSSSGTSCLKIVSWNVQTFFDSQIDGNEYSDFKKSSYNWGKESYIQRLDRLCEVINALDADIFVMQEIENSGILCDISNKLAGNSWQKNKIYDYGCFAKDSSSSIGCAVLSKHPLCNLKTHSLNIKTEKSSQPSMRPIMELTVLFANKSLTLFVNHWKSMSGGEEESDVWRNWQESVLGAKIANLVSTKNVAVLACGDFNRDIRKFAKFSEINNFKNTENIANIAFRYISNSSFITYNEFENETKNGRIGVYSPWFLSDGSVLEQGSYYYNESWNYIDNFFCAGGARISSFNVENAGVWADEYGIPIGYKIYTGSGYADHLPISCIVYF